ncbi:hypothetical protein [Marixanthomonas spongiae]|uniref:Uncharacterized protein n=1 Tax=Marixanthomonas spongiae TaxID=2174845 RepID=A0A2U0I2A3_9FLAO|nr:hypothetical protein [Marixanthomonas spongiae]PVW15120.1 hypothetical protein DDV96_06850 [Marixanthomonas spongiae]
MKTLNLKALEAELQKRLQYPYVWGRKQNNLWDGYTNFIYRTETWEALMPKMAKVVRVHNLNKRDLFNYTINRWYNFWSATAVEHIFTNLTQVTPTDNPKDRLVDFSIQNIPFDHKTTVFPKQFKKSWAYAKTHEKELIEWLYDNQSIQQRHHLKNRLFIVVFDKNGEHWKLKANLSLLKAEIEKYVSNFNPNKLHSLTFADNSQALSAIIWVTT